MKSRFSGSAARLLHLRDSEPSFYIWISDVCSIASACGFFCVFCIRLFSVFVFKKSQKRSIWTLARLSSTQVFDLVWATSFVTVWFMAVVFGYQMNGPAMTYAALFILLGLPVLRVMLTFTLDGLDNRREG